MEVIRHDIYPICARIIDHSRNVKVSEVPITGWDGEGYPVRNSGRVKDRA